MKKFLVVAILAFGVSTTTAGCATVSKTAESGEKIVKVGGEIAPTIFDALASIFGILKGASDDVKSATDAAGLTEAAPEAAPAPSPTPNP